MRILRRIVVLIGFVLVGAVHVHAERLEPVEAERSVPVLLPVALNVVPGLGIGSFVQGDGVGGLIGLGGELTGLGLIGAGYLFTAAGVFTAFADEGAFLKAGILMFAGGVTTFSVTKVFEIVRPIVYALRH